MFGNIIKSMGKRSALFNIKCEIRNMNISFPHAPEVVSTNIKNYLKMCLNAFDMGVGINISDIDQLVRENVGSSQKSQLEEILLTLNRLANCGFNKEIEKMNQHESALQSLFKQSTGEVINF